MPPPCVLTSPGAKRGGATDHSATSSEINSVFVFPTSMASTGEPSSFQMSDGQKRQRRSSSGCQRTFRRRGCRTVHDTLVTSTPRSAMMNQVAPASLPAFS